MSRGRTSSFELHYATGNPQALREVASELRRGKVDLAVSSGPATRAMTEVTEVPVLFALSGDPVELGIVKSLGQPGGNFTGSTFLSLELAGKRVELLKEVVPNLRKLAVLSNAIIRENNRSGARPSEAAQKLGIETVYVPFAGENELDKALGSGGRRASGRVAGLPGRPHDGAPSQNCRLRYRASAAVDVRLGRILRRRRAS